LSTTFLFCFFPCAYPWEIGNSNADIAHWMNQILMRQHRQSTKGKIKFDHRTFDPYKKCIKQSNLHVLFSSIDWSNRVQSLCCDPLKVVQTGRTAGDLFKSRQSFVSINGTKGFKSFFFLTATRKKRFRKKQTRTFQLVSVLGKKTNKNDGQCELGSWWGLGCFRGVLLCGPSSLKHTHGEMARSLRKAFWFPRCNRIAQKKKGGGGQRVLE
jgi:hypothetical protein